MQIQYRKKHNMYLLRSQKYLLKNFVIWVLVEFTSVSSKKHTITYSYQQ